MRENRKSFDSQGVQFAWDSTSLDAASACLRKYYYSIICNFQSDATSVHLLFGGIYAKALETFYKLRAEGASIDDALRVVCRLALVASYQYKEDGTPTGPIPFLDNCKTRLSLLRSIIWYIDTYGEEPADGLRTYILADGRPAVELSFAVEFADGLLWCGHLDRVVSHGDALYWSDNKTTKSSLGPHYYAGFAPHNQFMGYTYAGQIVLHSPIRGGIIDAAQIGANFTRFERVPITFSKEQIEEWREQALYHIEAARRATLEGYFPMNLASCGNYGGCPFRLLCARSPHGREPFLRGNFRERAEPWDPINPR